MYARLRNLVRRTAEKGCLALMIWCVLLLGGAGAGAGSAFGQIPCGGYDYITWPNLNCGFGPSPGTPAALNSAGHVCGFFLSCNGNEGYRTFLWTGGPTTTVLPLPAGYKAMQAAAMNDLNEIVGSLQTNAGSFRAFLRRANGEVIDLGLPPGTDMAYATGINNKSEISGYGVGVGSRAFIWRGGSFTMLDLPIGPYSRALAINDASQVTGWMGNWPISSAGFRWQNGTAIAFAPLPDDTTMSPNALSPGGKVAGISLPWGSTGFRGFVFENGVTNVLPVLPDYLWTRPTDCNDFVVAGICEAGQGNNAGFVWSDGQMRKISDLVAIPNLVIYGVGAITPDGRMVCNGFIGGTHLGLILLPDYTSSVGDITNDCQVNVNDLLLVINEWGKRKSNADINKDGIVNALDLMLVIQNWDSS